jgi:superfamily II DNA/RNA helicase
MSFNNLNLNPAILSAVAQSGYTTPTPIQSQAIPVVLAGHDLFASAQTGTGKTAAFILPALQRLSTPSTKPGRGPRVLVLTPTRELASQITDAAMKYGKNLRFKMGSILGGMPYPAQHRLLSQSLDLMVATPGRLMDHMESGRVDFSRLEILILDEADRMLDMGFINAVQQIAAATPATRQTLLFSATLDGGIAKLGQRLLKQPKQIAISSAEAKHENITQRLHLANDVAHKNRLLQHLLTDVDKAIVFTSTKRHADRLAKDLHAQGYAAAALHGDMKQSARNRTIKNLRSNAVRLLVATDVAARGIDVTGISHVINFDLPRTGEDYVHRIGRTGRAGASGIAISFALRSDMSNVRDIERYTGQAIPPHVIAGLEPKHEAASPSQRPKAKHRRPHSGGAGQHFSRSSNGQAKKVDGNTVRTDTSHRKSPRPAQRISFSQKRRTANHSAV